MLKINTQTKSPKTACNAASDSDRLFALLGRLQEITPIIKNLYDSTDILDLHNLNEDLLDEFWELGSMMSTGGTALKRAVDRAYDA